MAGCGTSIRDSSQQATQFGPSTAPSASPAASPKTTGPVSCPAGVKAARGPGALPDGYPGSAQPVPDLCAALAAARVDHQEVLLDIGANWCVDCRALQRLFRSPQVRPLLTRDYRVVTVDIGRDNMNLGFTSHYVPHLVTIPAVVVLTAAGKIRISSGDGAFGHAHTMTPAQLRAFLKRWARATATSAAGTAGTPPAATGASYQGGGVSVTVAVTLPGRVGRVRVTFAPQHSGFHLYSTTLRSRLTHGLGVTTSVTVLGGLRSTGPLTADEPVRMLHIAALNATLPVFPDGPVTVTVPVRRLAAGPAAVVVSYAACSASVCMLPVLARRIPLTLT